MYVWTTKTKYFTKAGNVNRVIDMTIVKGFTFERFLCEELYLTIKEHF